MRALTMVDVPETDRRGRSEVVRALRVYGPVAGNQQDWHRILDLASHTSVNALVVDLKQEAGTVLYASSVATAHRIGAVRPSYDVAKLLDDIKGRGLQAIGRLVAFQDSKLASAHPNLATRDRRTGDTWRTSAGEAWLDPTQPDGWYYIGQIAAEAIRLGFDEVQLDYARFPTGRDVQHLQFSVELDANVRIDAIRSFAQTVRDAVRRERGLLGIDIFGIISSVPDDQGIGQQMEVLADTVDIVCPMVYPSHYSPGWLHLEDPAAHPAVVVGHALNDASRRIGNSAVLRPWLQGWALPTSRMISQMHEAENRGLGWMLWNATSQYDSEVLPV